MYVHVYCACKNTCVARRIHSENYNDYIVCVYRDWYMCFCLVPVSSVIHVQRPTYSLSPLTSRPLSGTRLETPTGEVSGGGGACNVKVTKVCSCSPGHLEKFVKTSLNLVQFQNFKHQHLANSPTILIVSLQALPVQRLLMICFLCTVYTSCSTIHAKLQQQKIYMYITVICDMYMKNMCIAH